MASIPYDDGPALWLGLGEFRNRHEFDEVGVARQCFLDAIVKDAPDVLHDLSDEPLRLFRPLLARAAAALPEDRQPFAWQYLRYQGAFSWGSFKYADDARRPEDAEVRSALTRWARRWNLDQSRDDWVMARAVDTLFGWADYAVAPPAERLTWTDEARSTTIELTDQERRIELPSFTWNPQFEREAEARERIRAAVNAQLEAHLGRIRDLAKQRHLPTDHLKSGAAHFRWLVWYQVLEMDWRPEVAK